MSYIVLNRINAQIEASKKLEEKRKKEKLKDQEKLRELTGIQDESKSKPVQTSLTPIELKKILMEELAPVVNSDVKEDNKDIHMAFGGIIEFVDWLTPNLDKFNDNQKIPLSTLIQVRQSVEIGCGCRRKGRLENAENYFKIFWEKNALTDLPESVLRIGGFKSITFSTQNTGTFLVYPKN